ncbi:MAG: methyltransferase domain-containing protein [Actinomycetota bacterium]|nr:methyltransferase domain-containing protein [Actinomycetota bacterium]
MDWDTLAGTYNAQLWLERRPLRAAVALACPRAGQRVLDVGTGTGAVLELLARRAPMPLHATGVDSSPAMLSRVKPLPIGWQLLTADIGALPLDSQSFDVAVASYVLHVLDEPARLPALREINRVLRRDGVLVTVTPTLPLGSDHPIYRRIARRLEAESGPLRGLLPLDPRASLRAAGFEIDRVRRVWLGYPSLCVRARRR